MIEQSILAGAQHFYFSTPLVICKVYIKFACEYNRRIIESGKVVITR
jgi:hypothetical protein